MSNPDERLDMIDMHTAHIEEVNVKLKAENKELWKDLKERKGASGVLQQIADKLKSLTGEQNVWKAIEQLEAKKKRLRDALQSLYDEQNGPPLLRHEKNWQAAMDEAETLLGDN